MPIPIPIIFSLLLLITINSLTISIIFFNILSCFTSLFLIVFLSIILPFKSIKTLLISSISTSIPITIIALGLSSIKMGFLPPFDLPHPTSRTNPFLFNLQTILDTVAAVKLVLSTISVLDIEECSQIVFRIKVVLILDKKSELAFSLLFIYLFIYNQHFFSLCNNV